MSFKYTDLPNSQVATHGLRSPAAAPALLCLVLPALSSLTRSLSLSFRCDAHSLVSDSCTRDYMFCKYVFLLFFSFCVLTALFRLL
jgi:hypothetical protein